MASIKVRFGDIHTYKANKRGMSELRSSDGVQAFIIGEAIDIADALNGSFAGTYEVGPNYFEHGMTDFEPVIGARHNPPEGAHAFIRTADDVAEREQSMFNVLNIIR